MPEARWFLGHARSVDDDTIDEWTELLQAQIQDTSPGWDVTVTPGRDDYKKHAAAAGGWAPWMRRVYAGTNMTGEPNYHGIAIPVEALERYSLIMPRATCQLAEGFVAEGKHAVAWHWESGYIVNVSGYERLPDDNWKAYGALILDGYDE